MMPDLANNLSDYQKLSFRVSHIEEMLGEQDTMLKEHDKLLIRGNGEPSIQERLRNIESFVKDTRYWTKVLIGIYLTTMIPIVISVVIYVLKQMP